MKVRVNVDTETLKKKAGPEKIAMANKNGRNDWLEENYW